MINNFAYVVFLSAAEDVLEQHAGAVLFVDVVPGLLLKASLGLWFQQLSYGRLVSTVSITGAAAFLLGASCAQNPSAIGHLILLASIAFISLAGALGEATFLALTALYGGETLAAWSSGTGFAGVAGAASYVALVSVLGLRPRAALFSLAFTPLLIAFAYRFLPRPEENRATIRMRSTDKSTELLSEATQSKSTELWRSRHDAQLPQQPGMTLFRQLFQRFLLPLGLVYFAEYSINQGVLPTFDGHTAYLRDDSVARADEKSPHAMYRTYQLVYQIAVFVSRSSIFLFQIQRLWIFPVVQFGNLLLLWSLSVHPGFFPELLRSFIFVGSVVFLEGLLGGASYANTFWKIRVMTHPQAREWALAVSTVADALGIALASIFANFLECKILESQGRACRNLFSH
jgi:battenin